MLPGAHENSIFALVHGHFGDAHTAAILERLEQQNVGLRITQPCVTYTVNLVQVHVFAARRRVHAYRNRQQSEA
jgi:hypothetical protein